MANVCSEITQLERDIESPRGYDTRRPKRERAQRLVLDEAREQRTLGVAQRPTR